MFPSFVKTHAVLNRCPDPVLGLFDLFRQSDDFSLPRPRHRNYTVGITEHDVRHTVDVLREYGNLGSGSFLFSYQRLLGEGQVRRGDYGVMMTMGPGSTIETALLRW